MKLKKICILFVIAYFFIPLHFSHGLIERISVASDETQANGHSYTGGATSDGRYLIFTSTASNLVVGDTNGVSDVFLYDRETKMIEMVSVAADGSLGNGLAEKSAISPNGRYLTFHSAANNLVPGDTNGIADLFIFDQQTNTLVRLLGNSGEEPNSTIGAIDFSDDSNSFTYNSTANNLVAGDTNAQGDVFIYDIDIAQSELVSLSSLGIQGNGASRNSSTSSGGRYTIFRTEANNFITGDTNGYGDTFTYDRETNTLELISQSVAGIISNSNSFEPVISEDGNIQIFRSTGSNLVPGDTNNKSDVFLFDRDAHELSLISKSDAGILGDNTSRTPAISFDGNYIAYQSLASNLVVGDTNSVDDIFLYDRIHDTTQRISVSESGEQGNAGSEIPIMFSEQPWVMFQSSATNLVPGDTNGFFDVFLYEPDMVPDDITVSDLSFFENESLPYQVGELSTDDANSFESHTYTFCGGIDDSLFSIENTDELTLTIGPLDYEVKSTYQVCLRTTDSRGLFFDEIINLEVIDRSESNHSHHGSVIRDVSALFHNTQQPVITGTFISPIDNETVLACNPFRSYLQFRSHDNEVLEVKLWQSFLNRYEGESLPVTGYFGPLTFAAIKRFQEKYADEILLPWNLFHGTGFVYKTTRAKANGILSCSEGKIDLENGLSIEIK